MRKATSKVLFPVFVVIVLLNLSIAGFAANVRWKATWADNNWFTANNWDVGYVPTSADSAFIDRAITVELYGEDVTVTNLYMGQNGGAMIINEGETLTVSSCLDVGPYANNNGVFTVDGGYVSTNYLRISRWDDTTCIGTVKLIAGEILCNSLIMDDKGTTTGFGAFIDIEEGVLSINGDKTSLILTLINDGRLTGYGNSANIRYEYTGGRTIVTAVPEPATIGLLGLGLLLLRKRK